MTEFFQTLGMSYEWAWGAASVAGILLIVLPLLLAVEVIPDIFRTVGNVTADMAVARIVEDEVGGPVEPA